MNEYPLLVNILIYLLAAVICVPIFRKIGLGSVLGYLVAGIIIGPWVLGLISNINDILHFSEFGVVLLLFLIGLELEPKRLWAMKRSIIGLGGGQVGLSCLFLFLVGLAFQLNWVTAFIIAMILSLSSTAIALQILNERNLLSSHTGKSVFSILLFQDIAVIPMMALIPLLAGTGVSEESNLLFDMAKVVSVITLVIVGGHYLTEPLFRMIARLHMREIFTAFALLLIIGIALLMEAIGLSMALGSFLAGMLLAESQFRHELEVEIEPFKGLLMGLFFIAIGMSINFGLLLTNPGLLILLVAILLIVKLVVLIVIAKLFKFQRSQYAQFAIVLSQGGEFAFVLFALTGSLNIIPSELNEMLIVVVAFSMVTTPILLILNDIFIAPKFIQEINAPQEDEVDDQQHPVIIAGFGRFGRVVGRLLHANHIPTTILDHEPEQIELARRYGYKLYYGDLRKAALLHSAGANSARALIICVDDPQMTLDIIDMVQKNFPHLKILSRAHDMGHAFELMDRRVTAFQREFLSSAMVLGEKTLIELGFGAHEAHQARMKFAEHDRHLFYTLYSTDSLEKRISLSREARDELAQTLDLDKEEDERSFKSSWE